MLSLTHADGTLSILKLKEKFGTKALPTAEMRLFDLEGVLVGERGRGVAAISPLFNLTRVYTVMGSTSAMTQCVLLYVI
jgi:putative acyl-CoA dehydrogenase